MAKRKPELDLTEDENSSKDRKLESLDEEVKVRKNMFEDISFPGLIDFTDHEKRKRYYFDTTITSKDKIKIYYHKNRLIDIEFFDKIYNGQMEESKSGDINLDFSAIVIVLMLNFVEYPVNFKLHISEMKHFGTRDILYELTILANYIQYKDLENVCYYRWEINSILNLQLLVLYEKHNRDKTQLMIGTVAGIKNIENDVPKSFLSDCYDLGMKDNKDKVILNIIPFYEPSDKQLMLFTLTPGSHVVPGSVCSSGLLRKFKLASLKDIATEATLKTFIERYKNTNGNPGVTKFLHLLASFMLV
jgi:hypothetical protein